LVTGVRLGCLVHLDLLGLLAFLDLLLAFLDLLLAFLDLLLAFLDLLLAFLDLLLAFLDLLLGFREFLHLLLGMVGVIVVVWKSSELLSGVRSV
jgi:hypothetical protein